ncbi:PREDICTED: ATP-dependent helicase BRM-like [Tarenaya hassleriana]|uniref:ATP-dependent helicase BRM-like n=1 Tax=Tarenaya hassleriana TaxID=28532 RepID=UPI00053C1399|nr:PREDICTED: ATP-dependent helicase BRM-like [Tarenaya hassleriana]
MALAHHQNPKGQVPLSFLLRITLKLQKKHGMGNLQVLLALQTLVARMSEITQRRCKKVVIKLQRRIDKEGQQIVPMLTNLWKRIQNGYAGGGVNNLLDLREIDQRVKRLEYTGVMELASDVQFMLKGAMQFFGFSHEVRYEARKVHNLFFGLLKIAFPHTDFRETRNALSSSGPIPSLGSAPSTR